jgi:hypothetical protein
VIFTLQHNPSLFAEIELGKDSIEDVNYAKVELFKNSGDVKIKLFLIANRYALQSCKGLELIKLKSCRGSMLKRHSKS